MAKANVCYNCNATFLKRKKLKCPECDVLVTPSGNKPMMCPACDKPISRRKKGGYCPNCDVKLLLKRTKTKAGAQVLHYSVIEVHTNGHKKEENGLTYLIDQPDIKIAQIEDNYWKVFIYAYLERVVCPNCRRLQFKPRIMNGDIEHKCDKCADITMYHFDVFERNRLAA